MNKDDKFSTCPDHTPGGTVWFLGVKVRALVLVSVRVLSRASARALVRALVQPREKKVDTGPFPLKIALKIGRS